jgi:hypothetical protein
VNNPASVDGTLDSGVFDFKGTEMVLFIGGAIVTVAVFTFALWLFRRASREHAEQEEAERREREAKK